MTPTTFTNKTRALGLHRKYIGPDAVAELARSFNALRRASRKRAG